MFSFLQIVSFYTFLNSNVYSFVGNLVSAKDPTAKKVLNPFSRELV